MKNYKHTQPGYVTGIAVLLCIGVIALRLIGYGFSMPAFIVMIIFFILLLMFFAMTVYVSKEELRVKFGIGLFQKSYSRKDFKSISAVKNPWYYGFGIRITPKGWLYNVSGLNAVEITLKSGKHIRIGTDDVQGLVKALKK